ncbi:hypothetical protein [Synechococcus sp. MU1642]|uniref:hypothetical protein n=1 Tax=Synechococcus sp. MU1642 TaxID=2508348 RepID=UPI001CF89B4B|nr:hypothetical protein [Synechococcus sp. MU1642]MCB4407737.1 hypothetical protein [Synechococcus sp. MU1642]
MEVMPVATESRPVQADLRAPSTSTARTHRADPAPMAQMGTIHQPGHQLMDGDDEINIPLGMTVKTKLAVQPLHRRSDPMPAEFKWASINSGNWTPPLQLPRS